MYFLTICKHLGSPFIIFTSTKHASSTSKIFWVLSLLSSFAGYTRYFSCTGCKTFWLCWSSVWFSWYFWLQNCRLRTRAVSPLEQVSTASSLCCQSPSTMKSKETIEIKMKIKIRFKNHQLPSRKTFSSYSYGSFTKIP